jgi:uncharacterized protein YbcV (DUF1398 family)
MKLNTITQMGLVLCASSTAALCTDTLVPQESSQVTRTTTKENAMNYMDINVMNDCTLGSFQGRMPFPQVVQNLRSIGVESYVVDLSQLCKTYYGSQGGFYEEKLPDFDKVDIPSTFQADLVKQALRDIQQQKISYLSFLKLIMEAGVSRYEVFIDGRQTIYLSRKGEFHIEIFPSFL